MNPRQGISQRTTQRLTLSSRLVTSIQLLKADALGLSRYIEEQATNNPHLQVERRGHSEWMPRWTDAFRRSQAMTGGGADFDTLASAAPSLMAHVQEQIATMRLSRRDQQIAEALTDALEPTGWLGRPLSAIAAEQALPLGECEAVLRRLQGIEPTGLFARSLSECLLLQAREAGVEDGILSAMLQRLDLLAIGEFGRIARSIGVTEADVAARLKVIRGFDPKPGASFAAHAAPIREPDLTASKGPDGWTVSLNRGALPEVRLSDTVATGVEGRAEARALIRLIEGRNATLLKIATSILQRQADVLDRGAGFLVPMSMADIAEATGFAISTVSRVVAGAAIDTPQGTWWLRSLFSSAPKQGGMSSAALREHLTQLVRDEDTAHPLSDEALALALEKHGTVLARRTIAKYRDQLGIPPAHRRRRDRNRRTGG